jgi:hypothetical protein
LIWSVGKAPDAGGDGGRPPVFLPLLSSLALRAASLASMRDEEGDRGALQDSTGRAAWQQVMQARVAVAAHHQQVCAERVAFRDQHVGSFVFLAERAIFYRTDAMMPKVKHSITGLQRVGFGLMFTFHDQHANLAGPVQTGEGFDERPGRFTGSVSGHDGVVEGR